MSSSWLRIIIFVLLMILRGLSERDAIHTAALHFGVSEEDIKRHL